MPMKARKITDLEEYPQSIINLQFPPLHPVGSICVEDPLPGLIYTNKNRHKIADLKQELLSVFSNQQEWHLPSTC